MTQAFHVASSVFEWSDNVGLASLGSLGLDRSEPVPPVLMIVSSRTGKTKKFVKVRTESTRTGEPVLWTFLTQDGFIARVINAE